MDLKPIETVYNGYRFRSRLEARWAVFFDTLGIKYEYEKEGYDLGVNGWYLPDFWLPEYKCWIEIKGEKPSLDEVLKVVELESKTGNVGILFWGLPGENLGKSTYIILQGSEGYVQANSSNVRFGFCNPGWCKNIEELMNSTEDNRVEPINSNIKIDMGGEDFVCNDEWSKSTNPYYFGKRKIDYNHVSLIQAYRAAKSARFEHGEKPKIKNKIKKVIPKPAKVEKREILPPVRVPVVLKNKIVNEIDVVRACVEEGYQITQRIVDEILSYENPTDVLEYLLNNVGDTDFILEPETVDLSGYKEDYEYFSSDDFNEEWNRFLEDDERYEKKCEEYLKEKLNHYAWVNKPNGIPDRLFVDIMDEACSYMWWPGDANEKIKDGWWSKIIEVNRDNKAFYGENSFL